MAFFNCLLYPFVHDDFVLILGNPNIQRFDNLGRVFFQTVQHGTFQIANSYYRPILEILYRVEYFLFGPHPAGYHLLNILFHIGNGILLFLFLRKIFRKEFLSFVVAMLFVIHPVQSEAVASIAGISNTLMLFFGLLSLILYLKGREGKGYFYVLSAVLYFLALFVKEQIVVLPVLILGVELFFPQERGRRSSRCLYYAVPAALYLSWRRLATGGVLTNIFQYPHELWLRLIHIPTSLIIYLKILVFPWGLHYYRNIDILTPAAGSWILLTLVCVLYGWCVFKSPAEDRPYHFFGLVWFIAALSPVLNILPLINEYSFIAAFEHFLYFPLIGFLVTAATFVRRVLLRFDSETRSKLLQSGMTVLVVGCLLLTLYQNQFWSSETALFERTVKYEPEFGRARLLLGKAYLSAGRFPDSAVAFEEALKIMQKYERKTWGTPAHDVYSGYVLEARINLATLYRRLGEHHEAIIQLKAAEAGRPSVYFENAIGLNYLQLRQVDEAVTYFDRVLRTDPNNVFALTNLAVCYISKKEYEKARSVLKKVLKIQPGFMPAQKNLEKLEQQYFDHKE